MRYLLLLALASCTMFAKTNSDELDELVDDSIKAKRDVEIDIKSTPQNIYNKKP